MIIDAENAVLGRLASRAAKRLLSGEEVVIINAEKAVVSGKPKAVFERYHIKRIRGDALHGPFYPKYPDRIIWRAIRGMLPYKKPRGRDALKNLRVYVGHPEQYKNAEKVAKTKSDLRCKYAVLKDISRSIGAKVD